MLAPGKEDTFENLRALMNRPDVDTIVNACDAGREGELIFRLVYEMTGCRKPVLRLWISSMEDSAIREGFSDLRPGADYEALYQSALCRQKADWLVGINATRLFSVLYHRTLNVGRVQTPTLAMLAERDAKITLFHKEKYHLLRLTLDGAEAVSEKFTDSAEAEQAAAMCKGAAVTCTSVTKEQKKEQPPKLYDLTTLQREANRLFGYTAKQTLDYAQSLYEKKLLTYPRTDSRYLTSDMAETVSCVIHLAAKLPPFDGCGNFFPLVETMISDKDVSDHHAINEAKSMEYAVEAANELLNLPVLPDSGKIVSIPHNDIALKHVTFSYDGSEQNEVLHDVNLELPEGSFTALVGPSGGGKSTIARLIARFWDVTGGNITIGGKNIKELSIRQLSELVSFVTQDNFLFNCSLKENIRLGNPNATDEEVYAAAKAACCDEFIVRLDKGYDTPAGDAGKRLSGGEKQRIAIARAILKNAPIVILDEATAFTDPQNEDKIQKSIMALSKGKTLLVIAHRLSTIQNADQIVVLKKGRIVDCGKQEELLKRCPLYADMWKAHIGAKNWSVSEKKEVAAHV